VTAVVLFTRDLRVHDNPALVIAAREHRAVVPLFVFDDRILAGQFAAPNRLAFLLDSLADLRSSLRKRGGDLVVRHGDVVEETLRVARQCGASQIVTAADVSRFAQQRQRRLALAAAQIDIVLRLTPGITVVNPGALTPAGGDHYRVFTPYWCAWRSASWRRAVRAPQTVVLPGGLDPRRLPDRADLVRGACSPALPAGGETVARRLLDRVMRRLDAGEPDLDDLAGDQTTRLSPYLHFGCVSPLLMAGRLRERAPALVRQLAWRDFLHQVTAAFPDIARDDYRPRGGRWRTDGHALDAWMTGRTGIPIVDAGMRQLLAEGWMHNRARLITASFLTKTLRVDWRLGADHFFRWLVDGDIANNAGNWQWVAGTGNDTRPNRVLNPLRQAHRFDPAGDYVRRYVPELAHIDGPAVHEPWRLPEQPPGYPPPLVDIGSRPA
jgi:deoxyribodipyrimidine photo-lyase